MNRITIRWYRFAFLAGVLLAGAAAGGAQEQSAAEAARRARELKKKQTERAAKVWTNDNLPRTPGRVSTIGVAAPAASAPGQPGAAPGQAPAAAASASSEDEAERTRLKQEITQAKAQLEGAKTQLNIAQRDVALFRQQFFSDPDYASNTAGQAQLNQLQAAVTARQTEVQQGEQQVAGLEAQLKELEARIGPAPVQPQTPEQQQADWSQRARALRDELATVEAEIQRVRADAAARGLILTGRTTGAGSPTADLLAGLETRRADLQQKIAALEDEARRAGVPLSWVR